MLLSFLKSSLGVRPALATGSLQGVLVVAARVHAAEMLETAHHCNISAAGFVVQLQRSTSVQVEPILSLCKVVRMMSFSLAVASQIFFRGPRQEAPHSEVNCGFELVLIIQSFAPHVCVSSLFIPTKGIALFIPTLCQHFSQRRLCNLLRGN